MYWHQTLSALSQPARPDWLMAHRLWISPHGSNHWGFSLSNLDGTAQPDKNALARYFPPPTYADNAVATGLKRQPPLSARQCQWYKHRFDIAHRGHCPAYS